MFMDHDMITFNVQFEHQNHVGCVTALESYLEDNRRTHALCEKVM